MNMKEKIMSRELVCFKAKQRLFSLHEQSMNLKREKCLDNSSLYSLRKHPFLLALRHGDVLHRRTSTTQRQKFHIDNANQCLDNKSGSQGVPNVNLSNFTCLVVNFGKVLCSSTN